MSEKPKVRTCLWFNGNGEEAARFYVSLLPGSVLETPASGRASGPPLVVEFTLAGTPYMILNGGPHYTHSPAASIVVLTKDQEETDRLWNALLANGGEEGRCAWLTDRFGVSWQIVPEALRSLMAAEDKAAAQRVQRAMLQMSKIDVAVLEAAFRDA